MRETDSSNPAISRLTPVERLLWAGAIKRQFARKTSKYWKNLDRYGDVGSTFLSAAVLWLLPGYLCVPLIILGQAGNIPYLEEWSIISALCLVGISSLRSLAAWNEGKRFRQEHGEPAPLASERDHPESPPTGWANR